MMRPTYTAEQRSSVSELQEQALPCRAESRQGRPMRKAVIDRGYHARHLVRPGWFLAMGAVGAIGSLQTVWPALPHDLTRGYELSLPSLGWQGWAFIVMGLLIVGMFEGSYRLARKLQAEVETQRKRGDTFWASVTAKGGDVPIEDVFYWIHPYPLEADVWEEIGADIIDKLHLGQLKVWGRPLRQGKPGPLTQIHPMHWSVLKFSYYFFMPDSENAPHTFSPTQGVTEYCGLVFNADQIEAFWPAPVSCPAAKRWRPWPSGTAPRTLR